MACSLAYSKGPESRVYPIFSQLSIAFLHEISYFSKRNFGRIITILHLELKILFQSFRQPIYNFSNPLIRDNIFSWVGILSKFGPK